MNLNLNFHLIYVCANLLWTLSWGYNFCCLSQILNMTHSWYCFGQVIYSFKNLQVNTAGNCKKIYWIMKPLGNWMSSFCTLFQLFQKHNESVSESYKNFIFYGFPQWLSRLESSTVAAVAVVTAVHWFSPWPGMLWSQPERKIIYVLYSEM